MMNISRYAISMFIRLLICLFLAVGLRAPAADRPASNINESTLRVSTFDIDATPPIGSWMAYDPVTNSWDMGLRARGLVLLGAGEPIVLCALDWIGIANQSQDAFHTAL